MVDERQPDVETWGDYEFDSLRKTVLIKGVLVPTTALEFGLALLLFRNLSRPLSREYITQMVWDGLDSSTRSLDTYISHLRVRLKLNSKNGFLLASVYRFGYRLERLSTWERTAPRGVDRT